MIAAAKITITKIMITSETSMDIVKVLIDAPSIKTDFICIIAYFSIKKAVMPGQGTTA
ncbi:hypothetical protein GCM10007199_34050 [Fictibacillus barbaricus]|nr:hypothetical protein GCM10007199_34050 [Fictibacillus barbaricus]